MTIPYFRRICIVSLVLVFSACVQGASSDQPATEQSLTAVPEPLTETIPETVDVPSESGQFRESPMLAERVANGELPPVDERLPSNPRVIPVYDSIGQYGGTWRRAYTGIGDRWGPTKLIEERIIEFSMPDIDNLSIEPNWADSFEANADSTEYTVHIREGLRWSDGEPVTTEDVRFWHEDVLLNETFFPTMPTGLMLANEPVVVEIVDTYTFIIKFATSYALFPTLVARETPGAIGLQGTSFILPFHYLKDFHPNYTSEEELARIAEEYGVENWLDLWDGGPVQSWWLNPDLPVLAAWKITVPPPANQMIMERNPYYHAVDSEGNQLPYIDTITHDLADGSDIIASWVVQGLIDLDGRHVSIRDYDLFDRNQEQGNYNIVFWQSGSTDALFPNLNTHNPMLATLFEDSRFRQALSIGIDRQEALTVYYNDWGEVRQASPVSGSPSFDDEFEQKWTEYDPESANTLLDEMGLNSRDADGFRLDLEGNRLEITISAAGSDLVLELILRKWEEIGIRVNIEILDRLDYEERAASGDIEVGFWGFDRNAIIEADSGRYLGTITDGPWAPLYAEWYQSNGTSGIEPPQNHPIRDVWQAWDHARTAPDLDTANEFVQEMISIHRENIWVIGLVGEQPRLYIVSNSIRNFPTRLLHEDSLRDIGLAQPVQLYFEG